MVLVACKDYEVPGSEFIDNLHDVWTDLQKSQVAGLGIEVHHIQKAYRKLLGMPLLHLDRNLPMTAQQK
eukprot:9557235-Heterocapsa_arctica.AAC.1